MPLTNRARILFLIFVVLGIYYPVIFGGVNSVDDYRMLQDMEDATKVNWYSLFLPGNSLYYRPLLMLSFFADKYFWGLNPSFMHLENMLVHAFNSVLVFLLAVKVFTKINLSRFELPLLSALLFALHPINTESVAWISGRTDPLASFFVLFSLLMLLKGVDESRNVYLFLSAFLLVLGCMCKEVAVFFLPAACLFAIYWPTTGNAIKSDGLILRERVRQVTILSTPFVLGGFTYLYFRFSSIGSGKNDLFHIFNASPYDAFNTVRVIFKVFGFYVKKMLVPLPLNFAIVSVNNNYVWLGIIAIISLVLLATRRHILSVFIITAYFLLLPAIILVFSGVTWTPVAERYLYLPSAFWSIGVVGGIFLLLKRWDKISWMLPFSALVLFPSAWATVQRNITWQDNLTLYQDTFSKSPEYNILRNELAIALLANGRSIEANVQLKEGMRIDTDKRYVLFHLNQAKSYLGENKPQLARKILLDFKTDGSPVNIEVLKMLARIDESQLRTESNSNKRLVLKKELLATYDKLIARTDDPYFMYRGGQMALFLGNKVKAADYFTKAYHAAPEDAFYRNAAKILSEKLRL